MMGRETEVKTIDVQAMEWRDKTYGNSYFSAQVTVNYGTPEAETLYIPLQYGYSDSYLRTALQMVSDLVIHLEQPYTASLRDKGIILRHSKAENCRKRDAVAFGKGEG